MQPQKQTYASFTNRSWRKSATDVAVTDDDDAAQKALQNNAICFQTFTRDIVAVGGKTFQGEPENHSARRYVGIDRLYSQAEVLQEMARIFGGVNQNVEDHIRQSAPADSIYITGLERPGEFIRITDDEKVFDRSGQQIWPKPPAALAVAPTLPPKSVLRLKPSP